MKDLMSSIRELQEIDIVIDNWDDVFSKIVDISPGYIQEEQFYTKLAKAQYRFKYLTDDKEKDSVKSNMKEI